MSVLMQLGSVVVTERTVAYHCRSVRTATFYLFFFWGGGELILYTLAVCFRNEIYDYRFGDFA